MQDDFNQKIIDLWKKHRNSGVFFGRIPHFYGTFKQGGLLIIGANPSYIDTKVQFNCLDLWAEKQNPFANKDELDRFYTDKGCFTCDIAKAVEVQEWFVRNYSYFRKFKGVSNACGLSGLWQHIDLFPVRCTSLAELKKLLRVGSKKEESAFVSDSVELAKNIIRLIEPDIILVENAFAAMTLRLRYPELFPDLVKIDLESGCHIGRLDVSGVCRSVPVFYSSMLTGQRALDVGSLVRLQWCMAKSRNHIKAGWTPELAAVDSNED